MTKAKKILNIVSICALCVLLILLVTCLVNYYKYIGTLNALKNANLFEIDKFHLTENREKYFYRTLTTLVWTCYTGICAIITSITSLILAHKKENIKKIR